MLPADIVDRSVDGLDGRNWAIAQIEVGGGSPGYYVVRACAACHIRDLKTGWWKVLVALIPLVGGQGIDDIGQGMNRIVCEVGVGDMPLDTAYAKGAA